MKKDETFPLISNNVLVKNLIKEALEFFIKIIKTYGDHESFELDVIKDKKTL